MKQSPTEVIRRGFEITVATWPMMLIRVAEHLLMIVIAIAAVIAIIVPIAVSAGLGDFKLDTPDESANMIVAALIEHWTLFVFILLVITVVAIICVAIHSFVQAGSADVYMDAGRALQPIGPEDGLRTRPAFEVDRFMSGGKRGWLRIFWLYNIAWLFSGVVLLVPILPVPFIITMGQASMGSIVAGCAILALWGFFAMFVCVLTVLWTTKATAVAMRRDLQAREALAEARRDIRADFGSHFAVGFVMMVIWFGGSALIGTMSTILSAGHATPLALLTAPVHIVLSLVSTAFSAAVEGWFLASFIALTES